MHKKIFLLAFIMLFFSQLAFAAFNETTGVTYDQSGSQTVYFGWCAVMNYNTTLVGVWKTSTQGSTWAHLRTTIAGPDLANATFSSNKATFNYNLTKGTKYYIVTDLAGASYTLHYTLSASYPINKGALNYTCGVHGSGPSETTTQYLSGIVALELENASSTPTPTISVTLNSPANNTVLNNSVSHVPLNWTVNATGTGSVNCSTKISGSTYLDWTDIGNNTNVQFTPYSSSLSYGDNAWNVTCCIGATSQCLSPTYSGFAGNRLIYVNDTIKPSLVVQYPTNASVIFNVSNISINYTASDVNRGSCWYVNVTGGTFVLANCANTTTLIKQFFFGLQNISVFVNDTFGNVNSTQIFFNWTNSTTGYSHKILGISAYQKVLGQIKSAIQKVVGVA